MTLVLYAIVIALCAQKVGLNTLYELIDNSSQAIIDCPAIVLFTFIVALLEVIAILVAANALRFILSSNDSTFWIVTFSLIIVIGGIVIMAFIILFSMAVIAEYTVYWYWTTDKRIISSASAVQSYIMVSRNHLDTIALQSTLIVPVIYAVIKAIKYKKKSEYSRYRYDMVLELIVRAILVPTIVHTSLVHASIFRSNLFKAVKQTFKIVLANAALYLVTIEVFNTLAFMGFLGSTSMMIVFGYGIIKLEHMEVHDMAMSFIWGFEFPVIVYCILIIGIGRAMSMNEMIILNAKKNPKSAI
ncbi:choline transporter-like protein 2 [Phymastichus coffea]|uniref:choline transporter-like protein 2 n=1 Tax=Phymastichus coffea TaxID=108790 RepID=UPI00273C476A|nr:choline transporter-like protein 2 [Phymastichus coffea]